MGDTCHSLRASCPRGDHGFVPNVTGSAKSREAWGASLESPWAAEHRSKQAWEQYVKERWGASDDLGEGQAMTTFTAQNENCKGFRRQWMGRRLFWKFATEVHTGSQTVNSVMLGKLTRES